VGVEPTLDLRPNLISNQAPSATRPPLRMIRPDRLSPRARAVDRNSADTKRICSATHRIEGVAAGDKVARMQGVAWRNQRGGRRPRDNGAEGQRRQMSAVLVAVAFFILVAGCAPWKKDNPAYCDPDAGNKKCDSGEMCSPRLYRCVSIDGGVSGSGGRAGGTGGASGSTGGAGPAGASGGSGSPSTGGVTGSAGAGGKGSGGSGAIDAGIDGTGSDAPVGCSPACVNPAPICNMTMHTCAACKAGDTCPVATPMCHSSGRCVVCTMDSQCSTPATPICSANMNTCVACTSDMQCMTKALAQAACVTATDGGASAGAAVGTCVECTNDSFCKTPTKPICGSTTCTGCTADPQCAGKSADLPACLTAIGSCVECTAHSHCTKLARTPVCGPENVCVACTSDAQCASKDPAGPGVCMFHTDGHCAKADEVLYVIPQSGCAAAGDSTGGTKAKPFCTPQAAITAVTPARSIVVIRAGGPGTAPLERWSYAGTTDGSELTVVGIGNPAISPGAGVGITISGGKAYLRGLKVSGATLDVGVSVSGGATLRMDRCIVTHNKGGLSVDDAGYDISNSVFADNDGTTAPVAFGGVYLKSRAGKPAVFRHNTVYGNLGRGLVCDGPYTIKGVLIANNTTSQVVACDFGTTSEVPGTGTLYDPSFDPVSPYHLTSASSCVDKAGTADVPPDDIDGNPRPSGLFADCGAHELQK
jgi:hypothetical protein